MNSILRFLWKRQRLQGARCMACGVPFCQAGMMIGGMASGCPLNNLVPECNDLVYHGNWEEAYRRLDEDALLPGIYIPCLPGSVRGSLHVQSEW